MSDPVLKDKILVQISKISSEDDLLHVIAAAKDRMTALGVAECYPDSPKSEDDK